MRMIARERRRATDLAAQLEPAQQCRDVVGMTEQLRIHQRRSQWIRAGQLHLPAALRIQPHDVDGIAVAERERKRAAVAARRLEYDLDIRARVALAACERSPWTRTHCSKAVPCETARIRRILARSLGAARQDIPYDDGFFISMSTPTAR